jgi:hypothetical protein
MPVKTGIQENKGWIPSFDGMTKIDDGQSGPIEKLEMTS